jgi:hypothetical protein
MDKIKLKTGVSYDPSRRIRKFKSIIKIDGKTKALGYYRTEDEAHAAYLQAKAEKDVLNK